MSYDDERTLEELNRDNKALLKHLANQTGNVAVTGSAIIKEVTKDNANLKKAKFVEENYMTTWGWIKSWFKSKPKDADLDDIDDRNTDLRVKQASKDYEEAKNQFDRNSELLKTSTDKDFKDTAYNIISANLDRLKNNAEGLGEELDRQNKMFEEQEYSKNRRIKY